MCIRYSKPHIGECAWRDSNSQSRRRMILSHMRISIPPQTHFITATLEFLDSAVNIVLSCPNQWWPCLKTYGCFKMMQRLRIAIPHLRSLSQWLSWSPAHSSFWFELYMHHFCGSTGIQTQNFNLRRIVLYSVELWNRTKMWEIWVYLDVTTN